MIRRDIISKLLMVMLIVSAPVVALVTAIVENDVGMLIVYTVFTVAFIVMTVYGFVKPRRR